MKTRQRVLFCLKIIFGFPYYGFSFSFQLAPTGDNTSYVGGFPVIRWAQTANEGHTPNDKLPNTFFAVAMDLPDLKSPYTSIHPRDKTDVANRLYLGALNIAYGVNLHWQGPLIYDGRSVLHKLLPTLWGLQVYYDRNTIGAGITYRSLDGFEVSTFLISSYDHFGGHSIDQSHNEKYGCIV